MLLKAILYPILTIRISRYFNGGVRMKIVITDDAKDLILGTGKKSITIYLEALSSC